MGAAAASGGAALLDVTQIVANITGTEITKQVRGELRAVWVNTATPVPTRAPTNTRLPASATPTLRPVPTSTSMPLFTATPIPAEVGQVPLPPQVDMDPNAAANTIRDYFAALSGGQLGAALEFWHTDAAAAGRSLVETSIERGETYEVLSSVPKILPHLGNGVEVTVVVDVTDADGNAIPNFEQRYQLRIVDGKWYIIARTQ